MVTIVSLIDVALKWTGSHYHGLLHIKGTIAYYTVADSCMVTIVSLIAVALKWTGSHYHGLLHIKGTL